MTFTEGGTRRELLGANHLLSQAKQSSARIDSSSRKR
jgi:hypothetical protein